ncbi:G-PROTEIN-RECEP-F1-2 domain-containing protein [Aphelenchoides fujianensis]|nr:G-PROTEIN-RECEP-F1-2 domain-containing protein [Aphelenchoides fujianensis]
MAAEYEIELLDDVVRAANATAAATCGYTEHCGFWRFFLISGASLVACAGAAANLLLAYVFISRTVPNAPPALYPIVLTLLDACLGICYVLLFGLDVVANYLQIQWLFVTYHTFILPLFITSKIVQLCLPYVLILVTIERYAWISKNTRGEFLTVVLVFGFGVGLRVPHVFAFKVEEYPLCTDFFRSLAVSYTEWATESEWFSIYDLQITSVLQAGIPFVVLVILNLCIVHRLSAMDRTNKNQPHELYAQEDSSSSGSFRALKQALRRPIASTQVRNAVSTTVLIVASYLCCSSLHIALTLLERFDSDLLKLEDDPTKASVLYTLLGDTISASFMLTSSGRILIYCKCNPQIRVGIMRTLNCFRCSIDRSGSGRGIGKGTAASTADSTTHFAHL